MTCFEMRLPCLRSPIDQTRQRNICKSLRGVTRILSLINTSSRPNVFFCFFFFRGGPKATLPMMEKSLRPGAAQCLHTAFDSRNIFTTIIEDSSNNGLHGRIHRPGVDRVPLGSIIIDTFCQAYGEALLRKIGVGCLFRHDGVYPT